MKWEEIRYPFYLPKDDKTGTELRKALFSNFVKYFEFDLMSYERSVGSFKRLLYGKRSYNNTSNLYHPPYDGEKFPDRDHSMIFKKKGTDRIIFVNCPYQFDKEKLEVWCNERNLIYVVCDKARSFYYPYKSEMIMVMSENTYLDLLYSDLAFPMYWNGYSQI